MKSTNPIKLRKKPLANGGFSLYLDYYINGKRQKPEFLHLYLNPGNDPRTKMLNKNAMAAAETILAKRIVEYQDNKAGITSRHIRMTDWMDECIEQKQNAGMSKRYIQTLKAVRKVFTDFAGNNVLLSQVDANMLREFTRYLDKLEDYRFEKGVATQRKGACKDATPKEIVDKVMEMYQSGQYTYRGIGRELGISRSTVGTIIHRMTMPDPQPKMLTDTTKVIYFAKVGAFLGRAVRKGLIPNNPVLQLEKDEKPQCTEKERQYLTIEELALLVKTPVQYENVKRLFLFGCYTGLRYSDMKNVTWRMIDEKLVRTKMIKTEKWIWLPLSDNSLALIPPKPADADPTDKVFTNLPSLSTINIHLNKWMKNAGIDKHISIHCARHTFATLILSHGGDIYTTSKLLGHKSVKTTEIYAKIIDKKKDEAVNLIPSLDFAK